MSLWRRLWRVRPLSTLLLCLPIWAVIGWYAWKSWAHLNDYRSFAREDVSLDLSDFQLSLHDVLRQDLRRIDLPARPEPAHLPVFELFLKREELAILEGLPARQNKRQYAAAELEVEGENYPVELRLRGSQAWHVLPEQMSFKAKLSKERLLRGVRTFQLVNDADPLGMGDLLALSLAREFGVLTPEIEFVRLRLNGSDRGVYRFESQPDEILLRRRQRVPGDMFSGNLNADQGGDLWQSAALWKKVASRSPELANDLGVLEELLEHLRRDSERQFAAFAEERLDLEAFARMEAIDIAFGGAEHNARENQKLAFDPYIGRIFPIAVQIEGFRHQPIFNLTESPLLERLRFVPRYRRLRIEQLAHFLEGPGNPAQVRERGLALLGKVLPEWLADPYWDATRLLPEVDRFHRQLVRPMNETKLSMVFEVAQRTYAERHAYLMQELKKNPLRTVLGDAQPDGRQNLWLIVEGEAGVDLDALQLSLAQDCRDSRFSVQRADVRLEGPAAGGRLEIDPTWELSPGVRLVERPNPSPNRGALMLQPIRAVYRLELQAACRVSRVVVEGTSWATGTRLRSQSVPLVESERLGLDTSSPDCDQNWGPGAGRLACPAWALELPAPRSFQVGPGPVAVEGIRRYSARDRVVIAAGTQLRLGPGAALLFEGPVDFQGTSGNPITLEPVGAEPYGGLALLGPATRGSRIQGVKAWGGSSFRARGATFPGMINLHDTAELVVRDCSFGRNHGTNDLVHAVYVDGLTLDNLQVSDATADAFDLEHVRGQARNLIIQGAGDECLDLMGADLTVQDSQFIRCGGNALSVGEESNVRLNDSLLAVSRVGVLVKNDSRLDLSDCLLFGNHTGVHIKRRDLHYSGVTRVEAENLFVVGSVKPLVREDGTKKSRRKGSEASLDSGILQSRLPYAGQLEHLRVDVLALDGWEGLADRVGPSAPATSPPAEAEEAP